jgi:MFS family permease
MASGSPHPPQRPARIILGPWQTVGALWVVACLNYLARNMVTTMHGSLVAAIPMSEAQFGLLTSAFLCVYGAASPFAGFLSDRFGRTRVIITALLVWSAVTWLTAYAHTFRELLGMRILMALSEVCYMPAGMSLIADTHRGDTRGLAVGLHQTALAMGGMLASIGGWLAEEHGWSYAFVAVGLPSVVYGLLLACVLRDVAREEGRAASAEGPVPRVALGAALASLLGSGSYIALLGCVVSVDGLAWIMVGWMPTYMKEHFGLGQGAAGFSATGYLTVAYLVGLILGGLGSDRWGRTNPRGRIFISVIGLLVATPGLLVAAHAASLILAVAGLLVLGLFRAFWGANLMPIFCLISDPRYRATGYGIINTASTFTGGLGIYAAGVLRDHHVAFGDVFNVMAAGQLCAAGLLLLIRLTHPEPLQPLAARAAA